MKHLKNWTSHWLVMVLFIMLVMVPAAPLPAVSLPESRLVPALPVAIIGVLTRTAAAR